MPDFFQYYGRAQSLRGSFGSLPPWARSIVGLFAIPGIVLACLSLLAFIVSILALLLLTVPVYRILQALTGGGGGFSTTAMADPDPSPGRKQVDVRVVD
ncbi:MAG TPA: hypothetical protein VLI90_11170 [Tepidisphaeraceae bacterium]|nr:hypothetical protein [Tepidisphaeraceae bacterium]